MIKYRGLFHRDAIMVIEADPDVVAYATPGMLIRSDALGSRRLKVTFEATTSSRGVVSIKIRRASSLRPIGASAAAADDCGPPVWMTPDGLVIWTEAYVRDPVRLANAEALMLRSHPEPSEAQILAARTALLIATAPGADAEAARLGALRSASGLGRESLPVYLALIRDGEMCLGDPARLIDDAMPIRLAVRP
jgi:hypothetical protein